MTKKQKRKIATLDFETDPFMYLRDPEPFCCGLYTGDDYWQFWGDDCADRVAEVIAENNFTVYAHNGGKFDFFFLMKHLDEKIKVINGRIGKATLGNSELIDSYLFLPVPLSAMEKDDFDYTILERTVRNDPENKAKILTYLHNDCMYLHQWVTRFRDRFGKRLTIAATAFKEIERTGYHTEIKTTPEYDQEFRPFYFGGRTQAIEKGFIPGPLKVYDIKSAYPTAMSKAAHPYGDDYIRLDGPNEIPENAFFARIEAISRGCLPYRDGIKVDFPTDDTPRMYNATRWEIEAGKDTGTLDIISIDYVLCHFNEKSFKPFVDLFYNERKAARARGDKETTLFNKLVMNSGYGRFGMDGRNYKKYYLMNEGEIPRFHEIESECEMLDMDVGEYLTISGIEEIETTNFGKNIWREPDPKDDFVNVAVAASITGWVRAMLWRHICAADRPVYCDTDSIVCRDLPCTIGPELGDWELEGETAEGIYIGGKKLYTMQLKNGDIKKAHKGAKLTHDQIKDIVSNKSVLEWRNDAPSFSLTRKPPVDAPAGNKLNYVKRRIRAT